MSCPDCFKGTLSSQKPTGEVQTIHGLPTYVARPEGTPKGLIVMIPDAFGWEFVNNRVLSDKYAKDGGYLVYLPDFMEGRPAPASGLPYIDKLEAKGFMATLMKPYYLLRALIAFVPFMLNNKPAKVRPRIFKFFQDLRKDPATADMFIAPTGFCWGGKYVVLLAQDKAEDRVTRPTGSEPQRLIDCGYTAHPSALKMEEDVVPISLPLSVGVGDIDMGMPIAKVNEMKEILDKKDKDKFEVVIYEGARHGFAVRGDEMNEKTGQQMMDAKNQALKFFDKWLEVSKPGVGLRT